MEHKDKPVVRMTTLRQLDKLVGNLVMRWSTARCEQELDDGWSPTTTWTAWGHAVNSLFPETYRFERFANGPKHYVEMRYREHRARATGVSLRIAWCLAAVRIADSVAKGNRVFFLEGHGAD